MEKKLQTLIQNIHVNKKKIPAIKRGEPSPRLQVYRELGKRLGREEISKMADGWIVIE